MLTELGEDIPSDYYEQPYFEVWKRWMDKVIGKPYVPKAPATTEQVKPSSEVSTPEKVLPKPKPEPAKEPVSVEVPPKEEQEAKTKWESGSVGVDGDRMSVIQKAYPSMGLQQQLQFMSREFNELPPEIVEVLKEKEEPKKEEPKKEEPKKEEPKKEEPKKEEPKKEEPKKGNEEDELIEHLVKTDKLGPEDTGKYIYDAKDRGRIEDIVSKGKAQGGMARSLALSHQQANSIQTAYKAWRRYNAAADANEHEIAKIFHDRMKELVTIGKLGELEVLNEKQAIDAIAHSKQALISHIYQNINEYTKSIYNDNYWQGPQQVWAALDRMGVGWSISDTNYIHDAGKPVGKRWKFVVEAKTETGRPITAWGVLTASGAGSVEDPLDKYDITVVLS
jgi:hypothetical protein